MPVTLDNAEALCVVRLEGEIDINCSAEFKSALLEGISTGRPLQLDIAQASEIDITAVQLMWAAAREAEKSGTPFSVSGNVPERIRGITRDAGLEDFPRLLRTPAG